MSGLEHGIEVGYRFALGNLLLGPRVSFRASGFSAATLRRLGVLLQGGWRFQPLTWLELSPWGAVGFKSVWIDGPHSASAPFAPGLALGLRLSAAIGANFSVFLDARYEVAWVALDGARQPFGEPSAVLGVSLWL